VVLHNKSREVFDYIIVQVNDHDRCIWKYYTFELGLTLKLSLFFSMLNEKKIAKERVSGKQICPKTDLKKNFYITQSRQPYWGP